MIQRKNVYLIQLDAHGTTRPAFRLAVLSEPEKAKLIDALHRMQIGPATRLRSYCILPKPPLFDDVEELIADIATGMGSSTWGKPKLVRRRRVSAEIEPV